MEKKELRSKMLEQAYIAGNQEFEKKELQKLQNGVDQDGQTITVGCGALLTIICC